MYCKVANIPFNLYPYINRIIATIELEKRLATISSPSQTNLFTIKQDFAYIIVQTISQCLFDSAMQSALLSNSQQTSVKSFFPDINISFSQYQMIPVSAFYGYSCILQQAENLFQTVISHYSEPKRLVIYIACVMDVITRVSIAPYAAIYHKVDEYFIMQLQQTLKKPALAASLVALLCNEIKILRNRDRYRELKTMIVEIHDATPLDKTNFIMGNKLVLDYHASFFAYLWRQHLFHPIIIAGDLQQHLTPFSSDQIKLILKVLQLYYRKGEPNIFSPDNKLNKILYLASLLRLFAGFDDWSTLDAAKPFFSQYLQEKEQKKPCHYWVTTKPYRKDAPGSVLCEAVYEVDMERSKTTSNHTSNIFNNFFDINEKKEKIFTKFEQELYPLRLLFTLSEEEQQQWLVMLHTNSDVNWIDETVFQILHAIKKKYSQLDNSQALNASPLKPITTLRKRQTCRMPTIKPMMLDLDKTSQTHEESVTSNITLDDWLVLEMNPDTGKALFTDAEEGSPPQAMSISPSSSPSREDSIKPHSLVEPIFLKGQYQSHPHLTTDMSTALLISRYLLKNLQLERYYFPIYLNTLTYFTQFMLLSQYNTRDSSGVIFLGCIVQAISDYSTAEFAELQSCFILALRGIIRPPSGMNHQDKPYTTALSEIITKSFAYYNVLSKDPIIYTNKWDYLKNFITTNMGYDPI